MMSVHVSRTLVLGLVLFCAGLISGPQMSRAQSEPIQLTSTGGSHPTASRDGIWIAYRQMDGEIARIPVSGGEPEVLNSTGWEPDWGRPGDLIVFRVYLSLFTLDSVTHDVQLIRTGGFDDDPAWSPLGNEIAVQGSHTSITIVACPGGETSSIPCDDPDGSDCAGEGPTWSPDAAYLAFEDGLDLLTVARAGGTAELIHHCPWDLSEPAWSPDGQWIAVTMGDSTSYDYRHIWVIDARGSSFGLSQQTFGSFADGDPAWSSDGGAIYFSSSRTGNSEIWMVQVSLPTPVEQATWGQIKNRFR